MTKDSAKPAADKDCSMPDPRLARAVTALEQTKERIQALSRELEAARQESVRLAEQLEQMGERAARFERLSAEAEARASEAVRHQNEAAEGTARQLEQERQRQGLAHAERDLLFAAHLSATTDAVAGLDGSGRFLSWNGRFPALFGLDNEVLAQGLGAAAPVMARTLLDPAPFLKRLEELAANPEQNEPGLEIITTAGQNLLFRVLSPRAQANDGTVLAGRVILVRDISIERGLEGLVREIETLTRFELGPTLASLLNLPKELLEDPETPEALRPRLTSIRNAGLTLVNTVNMALDFFRMERGLFRIAPGRTMDLAQALRRAAKDLSPAIAARPAELALLLFDAATGQSLPLGEDVSLAGPGEPFLAHTLCAMLLGDALDACPQGGSISVTLREDDIDQCLRLDLHRAGVLSTEAAGAYFDKPATRLVDEAARRMRYNARLIAKTLGGSLALASTPHDGTTLTLRLPKD